MMGRILILAPKNDLHTKAVSAVLRRDFGVDPLVLDVEQLPKQLTGEFSYSKGELGSQLGGIDLSRVTVIWNRRPAPSDIPTGVNGNDRYFMQAECDHFTQGMLWSLPVSWINHPWYDRVASRKIVQLTHARHCGLRLPTTMVTNDPEAAQRFLHHYPTAIVKRTGASNLGYSKTELVDAKVIERLTTIRNSPSTFQEYISGADLRVTWIDGFCFAVRIRSDIGMSPEDCRFDHTVPYEPWDVPEALEAKIAQLMKSLSLRYGALDFRFRGTTNEEPFFLEVNPAGQFVYLEVKTGLPMTATLAKCLVRLCCIADSPVN
ncbi:hypothetical protein A1353_00340 [Methylomonas methanica]|uniref:ATP-grasp domain-containing protein n=1 Tax=Methylomonas methanica TaxID=421 RepID=A0A177MCX2_METMH|nr:hypothetical protein A1353_00340 [Methylomonas methanica]